MPVSKEYLAEGVNALLRAGILGVGLTISWPVAATALAGVGGDLVSDLVGRGLQSTCARLGKNPEIVDTDLQLALER